MKIYMDFNATTPVDPRIAERIIPYLKKDSFGNPSSLHSYGRKAREAIAGARDEVAKCINAAPDNIIFTGSGSEGDNHAIKGVYDALHKKGNHIITSVVEHPAVIGACRWLEEAEGAEVTYLPVDSKGRLDPSQVEDAITDKTILVSIMLANNETGVIFPIKEIAAICRRRGVLMHTDGVQGLGKIQVDVQDLGVDLFVFAGHKIYAPKGIGGLYIRHDLRIGSLLHGGHQEWGLRAGTENVLGIVALGEAYKIIREDLIEEIQRITELRDRLENGLLERIPYLHVNGDKGRRVSNTTNISFEYIEGEALLLALDIAGVAASSGSACSSGLNEPSTIITAMGVTQELARSSLRFSLGRFTNEKEVDYVLEKLPGIASRLRSMSPIYPGDPE